ncbi:MAG: hypothetical protein ACFCVD_12930 [Nodosilinea sp.]
MIANYLHGLTRDSTYQDLALRCQEFLYYQRHGRDDQYQLAEDMLFNRLVEYLVSTGLPRSQAEDFCANVDHLTEMALRISSTLGPVVV